MEMRTRGKGVSYYEPGDSCSDDDKAAKPARRVRVATASVKPVQKTVEGMFGEFACKPSARVSRGKAKDLETGQENDPPSSDNIPAKKRQTVPKRPTRTRTSSSPGTEITDASDDDDHSSDAAPDDEDFEVGQKAVSKRSKKVVGPARKSSRLVVAEKVNYNEEKLFRENRAVMDSMIAPAQRPTRQRTADADEVKEPAKPAPRNARKRTNVIVSESEEEQQDSEDSEGDDGEDDGLEHPIDKILDARELDGGKLQFFIKYEGKSYRKATWVSGAEVMEARGQLAKNFLARRQRGERLADDALDEDAVNGISPLWLQVDKVIAQRKVRNQEENEYLVKWRGRGHAEATWERLDDLQEDMEAVERFKASSGPIRSVNLDQQRTSFLTKFGRRGGSEEMAMPEFENGRKLRDYQVKSVRWMVENWRMGLNCILGDEMGLGKTAQSISVLECLRHHAGVQGPFLVVAPLTTLGHWKREIQTWTRMNVVEYLGSAADREVIRQHELWPPRKELEGRKDAGMPKFNVLLCSYEAVRGRDDFPALAKINWAAAVLDEAHKLKSTSSQSRQAILDLAPDWMLLLSGTPVQNNMAELYGMMNLLDPETYACEAEFLENFGGKVVKGVTVPPTATQVQVLQGLLKPILLRRMKEDVEQLPEKEEVVLWVEATKEQLVYYNAIYKNQIGVLLAGVSNKNLPNMRNVAMELRKCCCHPLLCNGLDDDMRARRERQEGRQGLVDDRELVIMGSGKMLLLHKLLPKLRAEGRQVLIFSQFCIMLDVIEDYLAMQQYPYERIDGSTKQSHRQAAIDRFSKGDTSRSFVFLLSTKAGGQGITLTAADTVIIYDSDWNPQNDLQAMARCHRIGQQKEVTVYRLVTRNTYEEAIFQAATRKHGLNEAILGFSGTENPEDDSRKIAELLEHGAHKLLLNAEAAAAKADAFASEDIGQILQNRTEKRQVGGRAGNSFSEAHFAVEPTAVAGSGREFWAQALPDAVLEYDELERAARAPKVLEGKRRRAKVNYCEAGKARVDAVEDSEYHASSDEGGSPRQRNSKRRRASGGAEGDGGDDDMDDDGDGEAVKWTRPAMKAYEDRLVELGPGRAADIIDECELPQSLAQCQQFESALLRLWNLMVSDTEYLTKAQPDPVRDATADPFGTGQDGGAAAVVARAGRGLKDDVDMGKLLERAAALNLPRKLAAMMLKEVTCSRWFRIAKELVAAVQERRKLGELVARMRVDEDDRQELLYRVRNMDGRTGMPAWWDADLDLQLLDAIQECGWPRGGNTSKAKPSSAQVQRVMDTMMSPTLPFLQLIDSHYEAPQEEADQEQSKGMWRFMVAQLAAKSVLQLRTMLLDDRVPRRSPRISAKTKPRMPQQQQQQQAGDGPAPAPKPQEKQQRPAPAAPQEKQQRPPQASPPQEKPRPAKVAPQRKQSVKERIEQEIQANHELVQAKRDFIAQHEAEMAQAKRVQGERALDGDAPAGSAQDEKRAEKRRWEQAQLQRLDELQTDLERMKAERAERPHQPQEKRQRREEEAARRAQEKLEQDGGQPREQQQQQPKKQVMGHLQEALENSKKHARDVRTLLTPGGSAMPPRSPGRNFVPTPTGKLGGGGAKPAGAGAPRAASGPSPGSRRSPRFVPSAHGKVPEAAARPAHVSEVMNRAAAALANPTGKPCARPTAVDARSAPAAKPSAKPWAAASGAALGDASNRSGASGAAPRAEPSVLPKPAAADPSARVPGKENPKAGAAGKPSGSSKSIHSFFQRQPKAGAGNPRPDVITLD